MYNIRCEGFYNKTRDLSIYCTDTLGISAALVGTLLVASKICKRKASYKMNVREKELRIPYQSEEMCGVLYQPEQSGVGDCRSSLSAMDFMSVMT